MNREGGAGCGEPARAADGRRVWVRRVPPGYNEETLRDKLLIHFLKPSRGGGEVLEVIYPTEAPGCALLTFQDSQVARRVMKHKPHILSIDKAEHELQVSPYSDNKVIEKVTMVVNLEMLRDDSAALGLLKSSGLCHRRVAAAQCVVEGTFREVQRVHDELLCLVSGENDGGFSPAERGSATGRFGATSHRPPEAIGNRNPSSQRAVDESFESKKGFSKQHLNPKPPPDPLHPAVDSHHKAENKRPLLPEEAGERLSLEHIEKCKLMSLKADNSKMPEAELVNRNVSTTAQAPHQQTVSDKSKLANNRYSHPRPVGLQQFDSRSVSVQTNNCRFSSESSAAQSSAPSQSRSDNGAEPVKAAEPGRATNQKPPLDWSHAGTHGDASAKIPNREKSVGHAMNSKSTPAETAKSAAPTVSKETETRGRPTALHDKTTQPPAAQGAGAPVAPPPEPSLPGEEYSVAMDTDVFQYIKKFYKKQYDDVLSRNRAECVECESGEITTVYFQAQAAGRPDDADGRRKVCRAKNELSTFYQTFQEKLCQEWVDLSPASLSVEKLTKICEAVQKKYKDILIKRYQAEFCLVGEISKVYEAVPELKSYNKLRGDDQRGILEGDAFSKPEFLYKPSEVRATEGLHNTSGCRSTNFLKEERGSKERASGNAASSAGGASSDGRAPHDARDGRTDTSYGFTLPETHGISLSARSRAHYTGAHANCSRPSCWGACDEDGIPSGPASAERRAAAAPAFSSRERSSRDRSAGAAPKTPLRSQSLDVPMRSHAPDAPFDLGRGPETVAVDAAVWTYVETFRGARCGELSGRYRAEVARHLDGDVATLRFSPADESDPECDPGGFAEEIARLCDSVERTLGQQFVPIDDINLLRESGGMHGIANMKHVWRRLKDRFPEVLFSESAGGIRVVGRSEECAAAADELRMVNTAIADDRREADRRPGPSGRRRPPAVVRDAGARSKRSPEPGGFAYRSASPDESGAAADAPSWPPGGSRLFGESNGASTSSSSNASLSGRPHLCAAFDRFPEEMLSLHNEQRTADRYSSSHLYCPSASDAGADGAPSRAADPGAPAGAERLRPGEEAERGGRRDGSDARDAESAVKKRSNVEKIADDTFSVDALKFQYLENFCREELDGILKRYGVQVAILQQKPNLVLKLTAGATGAGKVEDASKVFLVWYLNKCYGLHIEYLLMDGVAVQLSEEEIQMYSTDLRQRNPPLLLTRHNDLIVIVGQRDGCLAAVHGLAELLAACVSREPSGRTPRPASSDKDSRVSPRRSGETDGRGNRQNHHVRGLPQRCQQKQTRGLEGAKTGSGILPNRFSFETGGVGSATSRSPPAKDTTAEPRSSEARGRPDSADAERGPAGGAPRRSSSLPRSLARRAPAAHDPHGPKDCRADVRKAQDAGGRRLQKSQELPASGVSTKTNGAALKETNVFGQGLSSRHSAAVAERAGEGPWSGDGSAASAMRRWTSLEELGGSRRGPATAAGEGRASPRDDLRERRRASPAPPLSLEKTCSRCQRLSVQAARLSCGHRLCDRCLGSPPGLPAEARAAFCPVCLLGEAAAEGAPAASDLGGSMSSAVLNFPLPGHAKHLTVKITYNIPDGIQGRRDPYPGRPYFGGTFEAYLPDSPEGRRVLSLLTSAFQRGLTFAVRATGGTSGQARVTWNGIPHKTAAFSSNCGESYPDSSYLTRVCDALRAKGVE